MIKRTKPITRTSRPRKRKRGRTAALAREADRLWSLIVRRKGRCEACGGTEYLQAAHGWSRRYRGTRWNLLNGFCLDRGCHKRWTHDPLGWDDWLRAAWGPGVYQELRDSAVKIKSGYDLPAIVAKLKAEWEGK